MKCEKCKTREATISFAFEPIMAVRGYGKQEICQQCHVNIITNKLKKITENLKYQKKVLKQEKEAKK